MNRRHAAALALVGVVLGLLLITDSLRDMPKSKLPTKALEDLEWARVYSRKLAREATIAAKTLKHDADYRGDPRLEVVTAAIRDRLETLCMTMGEIRRMLGIDSSQPS